MKYSSGEEVHVGDDVLIEQGKTPGTVERVIETTEEMKQWNVEEPGILIKSAPFGLVFWPNPYEDDPVIFQSHENT